MPAALALILSLILSVTSLGLAQSQPQLKSASTVCVENTGGMGDMPVWNWDMWWWEHALEMSFELWNTANNTMTTISPTFSSGQRCQDISDLFGVEPGTPVVTIVTLASGTSVSLPPLLYSPASDGEGATATFSCVGPGPKISCTMDGETQEGEPAPVASPSSSQSPQVSFKGACVQNAGGFRMRFRLWDTATGAVGVWSHFFDMDGSSCVDGRSLLGVASGHPLVLIVSPEGGSPASFRSFLYDPNATRSAKFVCSGSTDKYGCKIEGSWRRLRALV